MDLPAELHSQTKAQLATHGIERFKIQLTGTKPDMIGALTELYSQVSSDKGLVDTKTESKSVLDNLLSAAEEAAVSAPPEVEGLPEMNDPVITKSVSPETLSDDKATYQKWPSSVEWVMNPKTGCRFQATEQLRLRMDLIPCAAPKLDYQGK